MASTNKFGPNKVKNYFKAFDIARWVFFGCMFIYLIGLVTIIYDIVIALGTNTPTNNAWTVIDKFTVQSNLLLLVFSFFFVFFPNHQFLKRNKFLVATMAYIFFTFFGYNFILTFTNANGTYTGSAYNKFASAITHVIAPVSFLAAGFNKMYFDRHLQLDRFVKTLIPAMIYPLTYAIYAATIPYVMETNGEGYSIYGVATDTLNNPNIAWPIIVAMILLFFPGSIAMFYFSYKAIYKATSKKRRTY